MKNTVLLPFQKQAIQDLISQYPSQPKIAERFLAAFFKAHKKLGGRDRKLIASLFYTWIKNMLFIDALELNDSESLLSLLGQLARKQSEEKKAFLEEIANQHGIQDWAIWYSMPTWIAHKLEDYYPEVFQEISFSFLEEGNTFLRFNESKLDGKQKEQIISNEELQINKHPNGIGFISSARNLVRSEAFQQGLFEIQDYGSQQIGLFTKVKAGEQVIDACCGAGGKALQMADMMQDTGKIWCLDIRMKALEEASNRADRAGFECLEFYEIPKNPEEVDFPFIADCVLLDAPCSGSGVFGRNPDRKYKLSPDELDELVNLQFDILRNYCKWVKPGGRLVYATCSIFKEENENQVHSFLKQHDEFKFVSEQLILPNKDHDGFYMAKLERKVD